MSLDEYRRKRDFRRTPEPAGVEKPSAAGERLEFVIQKHAASHLHYDFRLELDGTLKSWAVPKGPSLDPAVRRLAMHVEDHPLEYGDFEGVIPEGEYGGGTVLLWDRGMWLPEGDARAAYRRGRLKFTLEGEKLRGRWNLVRTTRAEGGKESWLLIKESDAVARPERELDIVVARPESVVSGRELDAIAADRDRVWHSNRADGRRSRFAKRVERLSRAARSAAKKSGPDGSRSARRAPEAAAAIEGARKSALPDEPKAQLATLVSDVPTGPDWVHEIKFDGYRLLCRVENGDARLISRNGKDWTERFPSLAEAAAAMPCDTAVVDGEAVVLNEKGVSDFQALQNAVGRKQGAQVIFFAFDLVYLDGYNLTRATLRVRKEALAGLLSAVPDTLIRYSDHVEGLGREFYEQACRMGLEGIICKRADRAYRPGRSTDWLKVKCVHRQEFVIVGFTEPSGSRQGFGALLLGVHDDEGRLRFAGKVGTGFTDRSLRELHAKFRALEQSTSALADPPRGAAARDVHWIAPRLVAEVAFTEWTGDHRIRHPSFQGLREDKAAAEVVRETPVGPADGERQARQERPVQGGETAKRQERQVRSGGTAMRQGGSGRRKAADLVVAGIRITNSDRLLYQEQGVTKGDLVRYWEAVAEVALPHLVDRPLTLLRCPGGPHKQCFFQKHWGEGMPEIVPRVMIEEQDGTEPYMYIDALPAVISLVQFGVVEFHVWNSRRDRVDRPDQMIFDLDPDEDLPWHVVQDAAVAVRDRLSALGLESFVKTTGGKGLHLVLPLARRSSWDEVRDFARAIAEAFARAEPRRYTASMSKRGRKGKIFIDYLRNSYNATQIAAYSPRARGAAPVSVPITWDELLENDERPQFTVPNVLERVRRLRRDPWHGFKDVKQSITATMKKALR